VKDVRPRNEHLLDEDPDSSNSRLAEGARLPELFQCDNSMA
jgi:hypothetical protein